MANEGDMNEGTGKTPSGKREAGTEEEEEEENEEEEEEERQVRVSQGQRKGAGEESFSKFGRLAGGLFIHSLTSSPSLSHERRE